QQKLESFPTRRSSDLKLTTIPKEIGNLINLTHFCLSNNKLTTIPKEIGNLINLRNLDLSNNELTTIPKATGGLTNLNELGLSNRSEEHTSELQSPYDL